MACLLSMTLVHGNAGQSVGAMVGTSSLSHGITITSPTGSSSWIIGSANDITWDSNGSITSVEIFLYNASNSNNHTMLTGTFIDNMGYFRWIIPTYQTPGEYFLSVFGGYFGNYKNEGISDVFSITTPPSPVPGFPVEFILAGSLIAILGLLGITLKRRLK